MTEWQAQLPQQLWDFERGCRIFRVHDVKENYQAMMMAEKILKA